MVNIPQAKIGPTEGGNCEFEWSGPYLTAHCLSDVGKKREHNEDSCLLCAPEDPELLQSRGHLFAVADGMGGANAGEFASRLALQTLVETYYGNSADSIPISLREAVEEANRRIFSEADTNPDRRGMGTTLSAAVVCGGALYIAQVGDSRLYVLRDGKHFRQVTEDHSLVAEQLKQGFISSEEARHHHLKNLITRAVGIKENVVADLFAIRLKDADTFLICSDGLSNMVEDEAIARTLKFDNLQGAAKTLVARAMENGGTDNITAVIFRITANPPKSVLDESATEVLLPNLGLWDLVKGFWLRRRS